MILILNKFNFILNILNVPTENKQDKLGTSVTLPM